VWICGKKGIKTHNGQRKNTGALGECPPRPFVRRTGAKDYHAQLGGGGRDIGKAGMGKKREGTARGFTFFRGVDVGTGSGSSKKGS